MITTIDIDKDEALDAIWAAYCRLRPNTGATGLSWSTPTALHWLANYFSLPPTTSVAPTTITTNFGYDLNGNLTSATTTATTTVYAYDVLNRLASSSTAYPGGTSISSSYGYDTGGGRVLQISTSTAGTATGAEPCAKMIHGVARVGIFRLRPGTGVVK